MSKSFTDKFKAKKKEQEASAQSNTLPESIVGKSADSSSIEDFIGNAKKYGRFISKPFNQFIPDPNQPRKNFDENELDKLQADIDEIGQLQAIMVRPEKDGKHQIIVGERRWRAIAKSKTTANVDAVILNEQADELKILRMQIQENENRVGVSVLEEAAALIRGVNLNKKIDPNADDKNTAKILGISSSKISKSRAILSASDSIKALCLDEIVNDYSSLYELTRAYKKHPDQITNLIEEIRSGEINNIRSSVKRLTDEINASAKIRETEEANKTDIRDTPIDENIGPQSSLVTEESNDTEQDNQKNEHQQSASDEDSLTGQDNSLSESNEDSEPAEEIILTSGQHIEDIDFIGDGDKTVMKVYVDSHEFEFTLDEEALETLTLFSR